ncbi:MAG: hypothetical protein D6795_18555 [Deltaproteobacteria bacterium]|nr:MAG: hypothetical protein D6795_18555 [Deltaproteobacteria bacterium]
MQPARFDATTIDVKAGSYRLRATGSVLKDPGFMRVYAERSEGEEEKEGEARLPDLELGAALTLLDIATNQHFTQPPPRFTEASLVKELEEKGIGRPSTYAAILSTIRDKEYVKKEKGKFVPTELGFLVTDLLVENFPEILDVTFTAEMEEKLDRIEEGTEKWVETLRAFYEPFEALMARARTEMRNVKTEEIPTDIECSRCGAKMVIRWGRNGNFLACSAYPECRNTSDYEVDEGGEIRLVEPKPTDIACEKCGRPMIEKSGRYGRFYACSGYPECRHTRPLSGEREPNFKQIEETQERCEKCGHPMVIRRSRTGSRFVSCSNYPDCKNVRPFSMGLPCPMEGCDGELVERSSRRGRLFYGCSRYPACNFVLWDKPVAGPCPACGMPILGEKRKKDGTLLLRCPRKSCGHTLEGEAAERFLERGEAGGRSPEEGETRQEAFEAVAKEAG